MKNNDFKVGDIVKISNLDKTVDDDMYDYNNFENGIFEIRKINNKDDCNYGLFIGTDNEDSIIYFKNNELQLICRKEDRLDYIINKKYLDDFVKHFVLSGELKRLYHTHNMSNNEIIEFIDDIIFILNDDESKNKKSILQYKALVEYIENGEEIPKEYKCLKTI